MTGSVPLLSYAHHECAYVTLTLPGNLLFPLGKAGWIKDWIRIEKHIKSPTFFLFFIAYYVLKVGQFINHFTIKLHLVRMCQLPLFTTRLGKSFLLLSRLGLLPDQVGIGVNNVSTYYLFGLNVQDVLRLQLHSFLSVCEGCWPRVRMSDLFAYCTARQSPKAPLYPSSRRPRWENSGLLGNDFISGP